MRMTAAKKKPADKEEEDLLSFIQQVKEGKYVKIDKNVTRYSRFAVQRRPYYQEEFSYSYR